VKVVGNQSADAVPTCGRQYHEHSSGSARSKTPGMFENFTRENREVPSTPTRGRAGRLEKGVIQKSNMHVEKVGPSCSSGRRAPSKWESTGRGHASETTGQGKHGGEGPVRETELH
jgi:hypothetical protein